VCDAGNVIGFDAGATEVTEIARKQVLTAVIFQQLISYQIKYHGLLNHQQF